MEDLNEFSDGDEENSSGEDVEQCFNKVEFMNKFCIRLMQVMIEGITQLMNQLAEEPAGEQHRKHLGEEKAMPPLKTACKAVRKVASKHEQTHTMWLYCITFPHGAMKHQNVTTTYWEQDRLSRMINMIHCIILAPLLPPPGHCTHCL